MKGRLVLILFLGVIAVSECRKKYTWSPFNPFVVIPEHDHHHEHHHEHHHGKSLHHGKGHGHGHHGHHHGHKKGWGWSPPPPPVHVHHVHKKQPVIVQEHIHKEHIHVHHIHKHNQHNHNIHKYNTHKHNLHVVTVPETVVHNYHEQKVKIVPSSESVKKVIPIHTSQYQVFTKEETAAPVVLKHAEHGHEHGHEHADYGHAGHGGWGQEVHTPSHNHHQDIVSEGGDGWSR